MQKAELRWAWQIKKSQGKDNFALSADPLNQSFVLFLFGKHRDNWMSGHPSSSAWGGGSTVIFSYFFQIMLFGSVLWCLISVDMHGRNLQGSSLLFPLSITAGPVCVRQTILRPDILSSWNRELWVISDLLPSHQWQAGLLNEKDLFMV